MALLSLQPPAVFLDCPGEPKLPFATWKKLFDNYLLAIGGSEFPAERKRALLIHCLGTEGNRIYSTLPLENDDYEGSVKALEKHFSPKLNIVAERYRFRQRAQAVGESIDHYVAALRELVKKCQFGAMEDEMLRDQIVEKTNSSRIRERLLMEEDLKLDKTLDVARRTEAAIADAKTISVTDTKPVAAVQVQKKVRTPKQKPARKNNGVKTGTPILGMDLVTALQLQTKGGQLLTQASEICATLHQAKAPPTHCENDAPAAFQKMMMQILSGMKGVQCYLDDVITYGSSEAEPDANLSAVLRKINNAGLKLNVDKCQLCQTTLSFLGQKIGPEGLLPDDSHVAAILNAPSPSDPATLRSFLGLSAWYSKFVPNYATVVEPIRALLRKNCSFHWNKAAQAAFEQVKQLIVHSTALVMFDPSKSTIVSTDASDYGVGAVLTLMDSNGAEQTVAFASRSLSDAERKYSIVEKKALACVWAAEKWRTWLWGRRFLLRTDHQALTTLLTTKGNNRAGLRIARWSARLLEFDYDVEYRTRALNHVADCLSRLPLVPLLKLTLHTQKRSIPLPTAAWEKVSVDIIGPFEKAPPECRFAISLVDYFSKWPEVAFAPRVDTATIIQFLTAIFSREGNPRTLISDNGPQFLSAEFADFLKECGIRHLRSSVYYPRANGEVERFNRSVKDCLQTASIQGEPWKSFLRTYLRDYRATPHSTSGVSPSELLHGRRMRTKLQVIDMPVPPTDKKAVRERVESKQQKMKAYTDQQRHAKSSNFRPGDKVR
ncbi:hypothetical protein NFI96_030773, partial [Prochilodus magdalenae]